MENSDSDKEIYQRVSILETELKNLVRQYQNNQEEILRSLGELKVGIGTRVEQAGKDIAVLYEKSDDASKRVDSLENAKTWVIVSIIGAFLTGLLNLLLGGKK